MEEEFDFESIKKGVCKLNCVIVYKSIYIAKLQYFKTITKSNG
jgi:hypothetical protein